MTTYLDRYDVAVIGTGFGGTMTALTVADTFKCRGKGESILMLERGTWWSTPVGTVQDPEVKTPQFLRDNGQPVQYWSSVDHFRGAVDLLLRCFRRKGNEDGVFELTRFGTNGFLGFGGRSDGVSILRACGVGGGSLVYANVTIRPPELIFDDPRWPAWSKPERDWYFELARDSIGHGVLWARSKRKGASPDDLKKVNVNPGLSNIATRTILLDPHFEIVQNPDEPAHPVRRVDAHGPAPDPQHQNWIDRARVFQNAMAGITGDYGTVDSSISNIESHPMQPEPAPVNFCERQGRCIVGCLPGARFTLNKQLMRASLGGTPKPDGTPVKPFYDRLHVRALAEVDVIEELATGGYRIHYVVRDAEKPTRVTRLMVEAKRVVVAAGCVGTNEIMLRSRDRGTLKNLSPRLGYGFSTNGDYLGFVEDTEKHVNLTRGPITTSFGHFNTPQSAITGGPAPNPAQFHTIEDNGIPRPFATLVGAGIPLLRSLANGRRPWYLVLKAALFYGVKYVARMWRGIWTDHTRRSEFFESEDERLSRMMCVAGIGRDEARGEFRLGGRGQSTLRVRRDDGKPFHEDPIYRSMKASLDRFAEVLTGKKGSTFLSPFLNDAADALKAKSVSLSHPLGGCRIAQGAAEGVVDEYGRVFDTSKSGPNAVHAGLYIADGAIVPTSLGVNPSLTIAALALRCADRIVEELDPAGDPSACRQVGPIFSVVGEEVPVLPGA
ncbi:MAG TPA: GMC oxidoreductase [Longimicrobium sp.]